MSRSDLPSDDSSERGEANLSSLVPLGISDVSASAGDHIAHFYRGRAERFSVLGPYVQSGLERGDRCIFISGPHVADQLRTWLEDQGQDVETALASDQLILDRGRASKEAMLRLATRAERSASASKTGLIRWAGDGSWNLASDMSVAEMLHWEALYDRHAGSWDMLTLCQFDRSMFSGDVLMSALRSHPYCIMGNVVVPNPDYVDPEVLLDELDE